MNKKNITYLIVGFLFAIILLVSISATNDLNSQNGRYEHTTGNQLLSILDTNTGVVKIYQISLNGAKFMYEVDYKK